MTFWRKHGQKMTETVCFDGYQQKNLLRNTLESYTTCNLCSIYTEQNMQLSVCMEDLKNVPKFWMQNIIFDTIFDHTSKYYFRDNYWMPAELKFGM